jgi:hypothetical protein
MEWGNAFSDEQADIYELERQQRIKRKEEQKAIAKAKQEEGAVRLKALWGKSKTFRCVDAVFAAKYEELGTYRAVGEYFGVTGAAAHHKVKRHRKHKEQNNGY